VTSNGQDSAGERRDNGRRRRRPKVVEDSLISFKMHLFVIFFGGSHRGMKNFLIRELLL
jgi:hypothetical protein